MAGRGQRRRRGDAQERFLDAFLDQAGKQLLELAALVPELDADTRDSVAYDLERMAETAATLSMGQLSRAARSAMRGISGPDPLDALRRVAQALRRTTGAKRLGPILVVASDDTAGTLLRDAEICVEEIRRFPDLATFTQALHVDEPSAVCLPVEAHEAVRQLDEYEQFPVIVHGRPDDLEGRARAMVAGAAGYVDRPMGLPQLLHQVRWRASPMVAPLQVFVLMDDGGARDRMVAAFDGAGLAVHASSDPHQLAAALDGGALDAVILGPEVQGIPCATLAALVRGHARCGHVPVMIIGRPKQPSALRAAGIDDLMRASADPTHIAQRVRDRVQRFQRLPWTQALTTGIPNRMGTLTAVDDLLRRARRERSPMALALLTFDGFHRAELTNLGAVTHQSRRCFAAAVRQTLRRTDVAGELKPGDVLVALPGARTDEAAPRIRALRKALRAAFARHEVTRDLRVRTGIADTDLGLAGLGARAEAELIGGGHT